MRAKELIARKGTDLTCPCCGLWMATLLVDLTEEMPIVPEMLRPAPGIMIWHLGEDPNCRMCRTVPIIALRGEASGLSIHTREQGWKPYSPFH